MKHGTAVTIIMISIFFVTQIVGLTIVDQYISGRTINEEGVQVVHWVGLPGNVERPTTEGYQSSFFILAAVLIGTLLAFVFIRFKIWLLWKVWFFLAVVICLTFALSAFIDSTFAFVISLFLAGFKIFRPNIYVHNLTEIFLYGGIAVIFVPIMDIKAGILLLIAISFYDAWAVWKSKHMVKLAKAQSKSKLFAGLMVPYSLPKKIKKGAKTVLRPVKTAIVGGGDVGFTLLFAGVVMKSVGFWTALIIPICATLALAFLLIEGKKDKFYPAMPFLTIGCLFGFLIVRLIIM